MLLSFHSEPGDTTHGFSMMTNGSASLHDDEKSCIKCTRDVEPTPGIRVPLAAMSIGKFEIEALEPRQFLAVNISVNAATRFQQIDGFGTSMAWWVPGVYDNDA